MSKKPEVSTSSPDHSKMLQKYCKIDLLTPYKSNAKKHPSFQVEQIANSIKEFGFNQPIVADKDGVIIVGHGRYEAAKLLGLAEVPVITLDLTEEQAKAYRLADNKLNESDWDMELVIQELRGLSDSMIDLTGFTKDLLLSSDDKDDIVPDRPETAVSKLGDMYALGEHRLLCGDSTNSDDYATLLGDKVAHMVFTDPPYNMDYQGGAGHKRKGILNDAMSEEKFQAFLDSCVANMLAHTNGATYICMGGSEIHSLFNAYRRAKGHWQSWIVWEKDHFTLSGADYQAQHELILHGFPDEYDTNDGELMLYGWTQHSWFGGRKQGNVWRFDRPKASKLHPTMKPVMLVAKAITNSSKQGQIVLDPFLGSGSTLIAAEKTGRICYGMELDPHYVDVIIKRWEDYTGMKAEKLSN